MNVLEIKNNLVKISCEANDKLLLAGFVIIENNQNPYVAQIVSLKADCGVSYAIARLMFTFDNEGIVKNYNGTIPDLNAKVTKLTSAELLDILPIKAPIKLGKLAQQDFLLKVDHSILENNLLICSDSAKNTAIILSNFAKQLENKAESSIIFDIDGKYEDQQKFVFGKDFKLPLNFETINFIYGNDLNDIDPTSKAVIQDIFLEVQEYTRSIPDKYIPFDTFIDVVTQQYKESNIPELALLKNKLLKYKEDNVFAQSKYEITSLKEYIKDNYSTILDISNVNAQLQKEIISYVYSTLEDMGAYIYSFVKINNENSDKKLLKTLLAENKIYTNIICNHNYKYVYELKEKVDNMILFMPETTQHDFASYNTFLNKLNHDEFIVYGKSTQMIPLIVELLPIEIIEEPDKSTVVNEVNEVNEKTATSNQKTDEITADGDENNETQAEILPAPITPEEPKEDFTQNDDTYTDLSDSIERIPAEEENYSAISDNPEDIAPEYDDFDEELKKADSEPTEISELSENPKDFENEELTPEIIENTEESNLQEPISNENTIIIPNEENEILVESSTIEANEPEKTQDNKISLHDIIINNTVNSYEENSILDQSEITEELNTNIEVTKANSIDEELTADSHDAEIIDSDIENMLNEDTNKIELPEIEIKENINETSAPIELPEPEIDARISEDLQTVELNNNEEEISTQEQTPYENTYMPDPAPLMAEDEELNDDLIEQVARDIDQNFIYSKIEQDNLEDEQNADTLTEDDLNFIDNINQGENDILEPVTENPEIIEDTTSEAAPEEESAQATSESQTQQPQEQPPVVPVYPADTPKPTVQQNFAQGDHVKHPKYGEGIVEKMLRYGNKTLCSINFMNVGRRLLDPSISEISKL